MQKEKSYKKTLPFLHSRNFGWRQGLQIISVFCCLVFLLGTCYRSATMYHPQRRAILHLKSQRRKLLESNIMKAEKSNSVTDLKAFKTRALHFAFAAAFFAAFAFYLPIVYLVRPSADMTFCKQKAQIGASFAQLVVHSLHDLRPRF